MEQYIFYFFSVKSQYFSFEIIHLHQIICLTWHVSVNLNDVIFSPSINKSMISHYGTKTFIGFTALQREDNSFQKSLVKELPDKEETCRKKKQHNKGNRPARDSGVAESLEDRDSGFSLTDGYCGACILN